jgi:hypothetical protein
MRNGLIIIMGAVFVALVASGPLGAQVYKVVDEDGNVTYTDQPPPDGSAPMVLPEITIIETDYPSESEVAEDATAAAAADEQSGEEVERSPRELRQMFSDFRILSPGQDETFWGTANTVVVSWAANAPYEPGMRVSVVVDGDSQEAAPSGNLPVTLDRGEHQVYAVLHDQRGRRIVTTPTVTFHVQQGSQLINPG